MLYGKIYQILGSHLLCGTFHSIGAEVEDKSRRKTKARGKRAPYNKRKRRLIQSPSSAAQNQIQVKRESLTNKMVQLQRLYISNNGAAPLSLLQPDHIYTLRLFLRHLFNMQKKFCIMFFTVFGDQHLHI